MCTKDKVEKIELTSDLAVVYADQICGVSAQATADKLGVCRNTVTAYRKRVNKFLHKNFDVDNFRPRMAGLVPLAIESLAYLLKERHPEVTMRFLQGQGLQAKDYEELQELRRNLSANADRGDTHIHLDLGGNGNGNGTGSGSGNERFQRLSAIYKTASQHPRLDPIDN